MKLKTLRDLISEEKDFILGTLPAHIVWPGELRQEAIKWIKEFKENPEKYNERFTYYDEYGMDADGLINWIKHFFNITDEDLNEFEE